MEYTEEQIIDMAGNDIVDYTSWAKDDFVCANTFYLSDTVQRTGKTTDTERDYNEVVAEFLYENKFIEKDNFTGIKQITRKAPYYTNKKFSSETSELVKIFEQNSLKNKFGEIIDVSVPLNNFETDMAGKIDILSYKKEANELFIVQIKPHSSNETLLRAILEIQTLYQTMDKEKFINDFYSIGKINSKNPKIKKVLVLEDGSTTNQEYNCYMGNIADMIEDLQIEVLQIEWN